MSRRIPLVSLIFVLSTAAASSLTSVACKKAGGEETAKADDAGSAAVPLVELSGVDTSSLIVSEKQTFSKLVGAYMSPCGEPVTLAACVKEARACKRCLPAAKAVAKMVPKGEGEKEMREWLDARFSDAAVKSIAVGTSPSVGPTDAPIQIVEFADFECPHCKAMRPVLHDLLESKEFAGKVRLVFKEFPLPGHEHAEPAARAALAAQAQGKFWEMQELLFENQETLTQSDIEKFARQLGLDVEKFRTSMNAADTKARVLADRDLGRELGVTGTPAMYINGRKFAVLGHDAAVEQIVDWFRLELQLTGGGSPAAPSVPSVPSVPSMSASARASAMPAPAMSVAPSASTAKKP